MSTQTIEAIKVGDKVSAILYGTKRIGIVTNIGQSGKIVFVKWTVTSLPAWMHLTSLTKEN